MPSFFTPVLPSAAGLALGSPQLPWTIYSNQTIPTYVNQVKVVGFSATPVLDATGAMAVEMGLTGDVTSSTFLSGASPALGTGAGYGQVVVFFITQDAVGHHKFTWPTNFYGCKNVDNVAVTMPAGQTMVQLVYWSGTRNSGVAAAPAIFYP